MGDFEEIVIRGGGNLFYWAVWEALNEDQK